MLADVSSSARGGRSSAAITAVSPRICSTSILIEIPNPYTNVAVPRDAIHRLESLPVLPIPLAPTPVEELFRLKAEAAEQWRFRLKAEATREVGSSLLQPGDTDRPE